MLIQRPPRLPRAHSPQNHIQGQRRNHDTYGGFRSLGSEGPGQAASLASLTTRATLAKLAALAIKACLVTAATLAALAVLPALATTASLATIRKRAAGTGQRAPATPRGNRTTLGSRSSKYQGLSKQGDALSAHAGNCSSSNCDFHIRFNGFRWYLDPWRSKPASSPQPPWPPWPSCPRP